MDFSLRNRHRLSVPQLEEQRAFWSRLAATSLNANTVALAQQNAKIMSDWIKYRDWLAQYRVAIASADADTLHRFRKAA